MRRLRQGRGQRQLVDLHPTVWVPGLLDGHWEYILVVRSQGRQVTHRCRYSTLREVYESLQQVLAVRNAGVEPPPFPQKHFWGLKVLDGFATTQLRASEMLKVLSFFEKQPSTRMPLFQLIDSLPVVDPPEPVL